MDCTLTLDGQEYSYSIEGEFEWGEDQVLYHNDSDVIANAPWKDQGFGLIDIFSPEEFSRITEQATQLLADVLKRCGIETDNDFSLEHYHRYVTTQEQHLKVIDITRLLEGSDFPLNNETVLQRISEAIDCPLQMKLPVIDRELVILRINRPNSYDLNPPHRDGYLDVYRHVLNVWIPLAGCNENSSLPVLPKSHLWSEKDVLRTQSRGASINGLTYNVPGIAQTSFGLDMIRPNPQPGQAIAFTPYLIHGSAINTNPDTTRMSFELRLYDKRKAEAA